MAEEDPIGILPAKPGDPVSLPTMQAQLPLQYDFFRDGREGVDRWGRPRENLWVVGEGWRDHHCQLQAMEACYGTKNKGARVAPDYAFNCQLRCGTCVVAGQFVATTRGQIHIEDVRAGDSVIGSDGEPHRVRATASRWHKGDVVTLRARKCWPVTLTPEHLVLAENKWVPARELQVGHDTLTLVARFQSDQFSALLTAVEYSHYEGPVYDLTTDGDFLVHNVVVHNCGGGGVDLSQTQNYCCATKGQPFMDVAIAEIQHLRGIDNLRIDQARVREQPGELPWTFPAIYFPTVEWGGRPWMEALERYADGPCPCCKRDHGVYGRDWPMAATTMKTAATAYKAKRVTPLRTRLGEFQGHLVVTGYTKDNLLDDVWDDRKRLIRWWKEQGVDTLVTPQYSAYPEWNCSLHIYNSHRQMAFYEEAVEAGIPRVAFDLGFGNNAKWYRDDWLTFLHNNQVPTVCLNYQQYASRGALHPMAIREIRMLHDVLPTTTSVMIFGVGTPAKIMQASKLFAGREICFSTVEAYARAAFYQMVPQGTSAPRTPHVCAENSSCRAKRGGQASCKAGVWIHNACAMVELVQKFHDRATQVR
jgi:hypothetical protein